MQRLAITFVVLIGALFCLGMSELGGPPEGTIPGTDVEITAKVIDRSGTETTLSQFSMDGKTYLDTLRGSGQLAIPFQQLASVTFGDAKGGDIPVQVGLKSGQAVAMTIRKRAVFYGSTGYGAFVIKARDIARIEFP